MKFKTRNWIPWIAVLYMCTTVNAQIRQAAPKFADYSTDQIYRGKAATPIIPDKWRSFRTRIREGARLPANFAGHYRIIQWNNGLDMQAFVLVDLETGIISDPPFE